MHKSYWSCPWRRWCSQMSRLIDKYRHLPACSHKFDSGPQCWHGAWSQADRPGSSWSNDTPHLHHRATLFSAFISKLHSWTRQLFETTSTMTTSKDELSYLPSSGEMAWAGRESYMLQICMTLWCQGRSSSVTPSNRLVPCCDSLPHEQLPR